MTRTSIRLACQQPSGCVDCVLAWEAVEGWAPTHQNQAGIGAVKRSGRSESVGRAARNASLLRRNWQAVRNRVREEKMPKV